MPSDGMVMQTLALLANCFVVATVFFAVKEILAAR